MTAASAPPKKIMTVVGARPQFIKAAVVSRAIAARKAELSEVLVHTGQHFDENMSEVFFREMQISQPAYNLGVGSASHSAKQKGLQGHATAQMLAQLEELMLIEKPDCVLVYGDTNSTLAAALSAAKLHIPLAHVEAGLRSFNKAMPEEINRVLTDHCSQFLFTPTEQADRNLLQEGFEEQNIFRVGDVMYDAVLFYSEFAQPSAQVATIVADAKAASRVTDSSYLLVTLHRQENVDDPRILKSMLEAMTQLAKEQRLIFPVHPRTRQKMHELGLRIEGTKNLTLIDPLSYFDMLHVLRNCQIVLTDSGGLQKEAYFLQKPCVTLREQTEWVELCEAGCNRLAGHDPQLICKQVEQFKTQNCDFSKKLYGDGKAAHKILDVLSAQLLS